MEGLRCPYVQGSCEDGPGDLRPRLLKQVNKAYHSSLTGDGHPHPLNPYSLVAVSVFAYFGRARS